MKAFRFTLEAVGVVRRRQEQKMMEHYARTLFARQQALEAREAAHRELQASWEEWRRRLAAGTTAAEGSHAQTGHHLLTQRCEDCAQMVETAEQRVKAALQAMMLARQQREIVDKFYEKQKTRHKREEVRGEQKFLDDLAGRRGHSILTLERRGITIMMKLLLAPWMAAVIGMLMYVGTTFALWKTPTPPPVVAATPAAAAKAVGPSWNFINPEADQLIAELKSEREEVAKKDQELADLKVRLESERSELNLVTQSVRQLQTDFDQNVLRISDEETANLKKLAKVYADMDPATAANILAEMDDVAIIKIMIFMKDSETAAIWEAMAKKGQPQAKRAAALSDRLRLAAFRNNTPAK